MTDDLVESAAREILELYGTGRQIDLLTDRIADLDLPLAYAIAERVRQGREARGERDIGRKIGFTNHRMWEAYDVKAPIWGYIYDTTVMPISKSGNTLCLAGFPEPKIEPEIVFGLGRAPTPGMSEPELLRCIEWISLGFEVVHSIFPDWKFRAADAVVAYGVHTALVIDQRVPVGPGTDWVQKLSSFGVVLSADGTSAASGGGSDVLGSPLTALRHLNDLLADPVFGPPIREGEIISTGTLTLAAKASGEATWLATPTGIELPPISVRLSQKEGHGWLTGQPKV